MNKKRVAELLDNYVSGIDERFSVRRSSTGLDIYIEDDCFASFQEFKISEFCIWGSADQDALVAKTGIIQKFYMKACELLEKLNEKKYTIQIVRNNTNSFLNLNQNENSIVFYGKWNSSAWKNEFTQKEIEKFKQRQDVAIDWDKAIIKEVEE